ncbi:MAG: 30S ribosomal protein S8e [archaeon]
MALMQQISRRKPSGGKYKKRLVQKRKHALARRPTLTRLGEQKAISVRRRGGTQRGRLLHADKANVLDPKTKTFKVVAIKTILEAPADANYVRRNMMVKGTVIDTELGKARITSRPGQNNFINAVLIK